MSGTPLLIPNCPNVGTTIFTVMSTLANEHKAINLGQGFPDFPMNADLMNMVSEVMQKGYNQYVPMQGYMPLREALAEKADYLYEAKINPDTRSNNNTRWHLCHLYCVHYYSSTRRRSNSF